MASLLTDPATDLDEMTMASFKMWSTTALKTFLEVRGKSVDGSNDELAAR
jgi:hypothetical protein